MLGRLRCRRPQEHLLRELDLAREQRPTDWPRWMRTIASAMSGPREMILILGPRFSGGIGMESVTTTSASAEFRDPLHGRIREDGVRGAGVHRHTFALEGVDDLDERAAVSISSST